MGNGIPFNMSCCNPNKMSQIEDIDLNKISKEYINYKTIKLENRNNIDNQNDNNKNNELKKNQTNSRHSSTSDTKKHLKNMFRRDSVSHRDPNISLFNNTFQILNNTQQYISFSNMNFLKNNLINNQMLKQFYNSKINSSVINCNKVNSTLDDNIININKKLILTGDLFYNKIIEIDKYGMKNSLRQKNDGVTIFGYIDDNSISNEPLFDFYLDLKTVKKENNNKRYKKHGKVFEIILDRKEKVFLLYFMHNTFLLYYKINDNLSFEYDKDYFLILGDIFMTIDAKKSINTNEKIINIQVEIEDEKPKKYTFEQKDVPIKIGRSNCTINIPKQSISKLHSIIDFSNDIFVYKDAKSTNGSTLLIKEDDILVIKGEMNFKLEDLSFKIKEIIIGEK
jgi:hypothetical protein